MNVAARRLCLVALFSITTLVGVGCSGSTAALPTRAQAVSFLDRLVTLAEHHDFTSLCSVAGDGNCADHLDSAGRDAVPATPAIVVGSTVIPSSSSGGQQSIGGIVLSVCWVDGHGQPYGSQVLVFVNGSSLAAINPVYWDGVLIQGGPPETPPSPGANEPGC